MCVCEWRQCGGCSCVLRRLCERGCVWAHMMPVEVRRQPWLSVLTSTLFWDRPSCVFSTAFVKLAGPQSCRKSPVCTSRLQGNCRWSWWAYGFHVDSGCSDILTAWQAQVLIAWQACTHEAIPQPHSSPLSISSSLSSSKMFAGAADSPASIMLFRASSCSVNQIRQGDSEGCQTPYIKWGV